MRSRRGFVFIDALWGILILSMLAIVLTTTVHREMRARQSFADMRAASRLAELTLTDLQGGGGAGQSARGGSNVSVTSLGAAQDVPGKTWVRVRAVVNERSVELTGLVPGSVVPATQPSGGAP